MIARSLITILLAAVIGTAVQAQDSAATAGRDTLYRRAQRLVNEGKGDQGRTIVDSLLKTAAPGSAAYAEGLFWRASLATTAAQAERDYRQITVDYALSPRTGDALLRLAQMELQRGDRPAALAHLERLVRENGTGTSRARASYWMARVYFEMNDATRACAALTDSRGAMTTGDVELGNQVEYLAQRCPIVTATAATRPAPAVAPPTPLPVPPEPVTDTVAVTVDSTPVKAPATSPPAAPIARPAPAKTTPAAADAQRFSVQVAAYGTAAEAQRLVKKYRTNGYDARVAGTVAPFRVRIGRFKTRSEAVALAKVLKEKSGAAFVVVAEAK